MKHALFRNFWRSAAAIYAALPLTVALAAGGPEIKFVGATAASNDLESLQRGARLFVNHCLNCHGAQFMRYNRLTEIGLTPEQIKKNLMFTTEKIGETMKVAIDPKDAKEWFGAVPPDLSVIARSYTPERLGAYLRAFYVDATRETGWNNLVAPNIGMPHAMAELQGNQTLKESVFKVDGQNIKTLAEARNQARAAFIASPTLASFEERVENREGKTETFYVVRQLVPATDGLLSPQQFDAAMADLVNFMVYMAEPYRTARIQIGIVVMLLLGLLLPAVIWLKKEYWKDVT
ncbi:MAG: cytochrome c1 [Casimicrobiaceae bacterium]|nr:cytochrome c1 [Casimicrobiaceae bacterium]MDW8311248.1 cytochrome c1 [Burkholderiales bacterium]